MDQGPELKSSTKLSRPRIRDLGYRPGKFEPGPRNSILDVKGLHVGQTTIHREPDIHTGRKIPDRGYKSSVQLTSQPIAITNTVSVGKVYDALFLWGAEQARLRGESDLEAVRRFTIPLVAETYDGMLNNIFASVIDRDSVNEALSAALSQKEVQEGNYGGGTGMISHGYKGGTGTSSRVLPGYERDYTLGVLVQANYGKKDDLRIGNVPVGALLAEPKPSDPPLPAGGKAVEGSIIVVVATDAPLLPHQLRRIAQHAGMGITQVTGHAAGRNFSGEIFLAFSTGTSPDRLAHESNGFAYLPKLETEKVETLKNETIDSLFYAVSEATEEAILNAMCKAESLTGFNGVHVNALPVDEVKSLLDRYSIPRPHMHT
ncbi:hypothetical protein LTR84_000620 [Exophiala bonariae]|uniref:D-aminopeptidase n=1 Tax=Exophiala bonariae TaxID=1690606 RepID=A0AAV9NS63_9EURO|nr:hypothetical protein LTR84_000620 [Exophiala bonariae]